MRISHTSVLTLLAAMTLSCSNAHGQTIGNTRITPDCTIPFSFTAAASSTTFNNQATLCTVWYLSYDSTGFSALSLVAQTAPNSSGSPGSWSTFTAASGSNPNTATTSADSSFSGYYPFLRVTLSSKTGTGTVQGKMYGWKKDQSSSSSGGGGATQDVNVKQVGGTAVPSAGTAGVLAIGGSDATGGTPAAYPVSMGRQNGAGSLEREFVCSLTASVNTSASGNTQLVAASGSTIIRVCNLVITVAAATNIKLTQGTGVNCATGTADLFAPWEFPTFAAVAADPMGSIRTSASQALCINSSNAVSLKGFVTYAQF